MKNWRLKDGRYDYCGDISVWILKPIFCLRPAASVRQRIQQLETGVNSF
ncbi:MAG: hypothetical protein ACLUOI_12000 [Eisenbergiella sp.]